MERGLVNFSVEESLLRQIQADRLKRHPNKIPFLPNFNIAEDDKGSFKFYEKYGECIIPQCIKDICARNYIDPTLVSKKTFIETANRLGYRHHEG